MAIYHASFRLSDPIVLRPTTAAIPKLQFDIRTGPTDRPRLMEILGISANQSTTDTANWGCGRNAAAGTALTNGISFVQEDGSAPGSAAGLSIGVDWSSVPTVPTAY